MATVKHFSFAGGELSPSLYARTDQAKYQTGARALKNVYVPKSGGAFNRPGTEFVCELPGITRLIPFVFNDTDTYMLALIDQRMLVVKNGALVTSSVFGTKNIIGISTGATTTITLSDSTNLAGTYMVRISGVVGTDQLNDREFLVTNISGADFRIRYLNNAEVDSTAFGAYVSGGTVQRIYSIASPYEEADLDDIQFAQSADVMVLTHIDYVIQKLSRTADDAWTFADFEIETDQEPVLTASNSGAGGTLTEYTIHGVGADGEIGEGAITTTGATPSSGSPITVTFGTTTTAAYYMVLRNDALAGFTATGSFIDVGQTPEWFDQLGNAPMSEGDVLFSSQAKQAGTVGFYQQRLAFGNLYDDFATLSSPEAIAVSFIGHYFDFFSLGPIAENDNFPFSWQLAGRRVVEIRHLVDLERLVVLTNEGAHIAQGNDAGALLPTAINMKRISSTGAAKLRPLIANESLLYLEARRSIVRDLNFQIQSEGYRGNDLTAFAAHLFNGFNIVDWDYQLNTDSIVFAARDDGTMLGCTYIKEQQIVAWHRHSFTQADINGDTAEGASVEKVCCIPEGDEDVCYLVVKRQHKGYLADTERGREHRYLERFVLRPVTDLVEVAYMDSHLTYDGRNTDTTNTMVISGGTDWTYEETLTLTSELFGTYFTTDNVGDEFHLTGSDGTIIRFAVETYVNGNEVTGKVDKTVPATMRNASISDWSVAVDEFSGLWHLEGYKVTVFADGYVIANPINPAYETTYTVTNGKVTLARKFGVVHIGLPFVSDIETLDVDTTEPGQTIADRNKMMGKVTVWMEDSRGIFVGNNPDTSDPFSIDGLEEFKLREQELYDEPTRLLTGVGEVLIRPEWNSHGRVLLRQVDPLPMRVNAIAPSGMIPFGG